MKFELIHELRESGLGWDEIGVTDTLRKKYYGWLEARQEEETQDTLEKNAKTLHAIRLARKELGIERSINNEQIRDLAIHKIMSKEVLDAISKLNPIKIKEHKPNKSERKEFIIAMGDLHYNGDDDEGFDALDDAFWQLSDFVQENGIKEIHLFEMGDVIEGASLRTSQLMGVKKGMVQQVIEAAEVYATHLSNLSQHTKVNFYSVDSSNHTQLRTLGTKQNEIVEEDLMLVFNNYIRTRLPKLNMTTGQDIITKINGFDIYISHGHLMKKKEGYIDSVAAQRRQNIDYGFFGHFHHKRDIDLYRVEDGQRVYDKKVFYVPALNTHDSSFERDRLLSSVSGFAIYEVDKRSGIQKSWKVPIE
jgi:hypothetical protein